MEEFDATDPWRGKGASEAEASTVGNSGEVSSRGRKSHIIVAARKVNLGTAVVSNANDGSWLKTRYTNSRGQYGIATSEDTNPSVSSMTCARSTYEPVKERADNHQFYHHSFVTRQCIKQRVQALSSGLGASPHKPLPSETRANALQV